MHSGVGQNCPVHDAPRTTMMVVVVLMMVLSAGHAVLTPVGASHTDGRASSGSPVSRTVLGEMFTATWCGPCINADAGISAILNDSNYFDSRFVLIEYHSGDNYSIAAGDQRSQYYLITGIPTIMFDGQDKVVGSAGTPDQNEATYKQHIDNRPGTADMSVKAWMDIKGGIGTVTVNATVQHTLSLGEIGLVVNAIIVEDHQKQLKTGHFLRMTAVDMPINTVGISVHNAGSSINTTSNFDVNDTWDKTKLAVVAWVQNQNTREVLQSGIGYMPAAPPQNAPPQFIGDDLNFTMDEGTTDKHIDVAEEFKDPEGDKLTYTTEGSDHISTSIDSTHLLIVEPESNWYGTEVITISAKDQYHPPTKETIKVTVKKVDTPPKLNGKLTGLTFDENKVSVTSPLSSIFSDSDGDSLNYTVSPTVHVKIVKNKDTTLTLTPQGDWDGQEDLEVTASDGTYNTVYQDKIVVRPVNHAPEITSYTPKDDTPQLKEGGTMTFMVNARDMDGDNLLYQWLVDDVSTGVNRDTFRYEPKYGDAGDHLISVDVSDYKVYTTHTFHVTVLKGNRPPSVKITNPTNGTQFDADTLITFTADVTDPDDPLLLSMEYIWTIDSAVVSKDTQLTNRPASGTHTVTVTVSDGQFERTDTVTFTVKEKSGGAIPGFEGGPLLVALAVALAMLTLQRRK